MYIGPCKSLRRVLTMATVITWYDEPTYKGREVRRAASRARTMRATRAADSDHASTWRLRGCAPRAQYKRDPMTGEIVKWDFVMRTRADDLADYFRAPAGLRGGFAVTQRAEVRIAE